MVAISDTRLEAEGFLTKLPAHPAQSKKYCAILAIISASLGIFACILITILLFKNGAEYKKVGNQSSTSQYWITTANKLIENMNETVNPCENFYQFVCGKSLRKTETMNDINIIDKYTSLQNQINGDIADALTSSPSNDKNESNAVKNARILYQSCIDEQQIEREGVNGLLSLINEEFGGWPMLNGSSWNSSAFNLFNLLLKLRKYNHNILFTVNTSIDIRNLKAHTIEIGDDIIAKEHANYTSEPARPIYTKFIHDIATELTNDTSMITQDIADLVNFEISNILLLKLNEMDETISMALGDLADALTDDFDFTNYIRSLYSWAGVTLLASDTVNVNNPMKLDRLLSKIKRTSPRTLHNYVIWRFLINQVDHMPKRFREMKEKFTSSIKGVTTIPKRDITCAQYVNEKMPMAVGKIYIKRFFDKNMRTEASEMFRNIRNEFINLLNQSSWMDETSKHRAMQKVNAIRENIGHPDYLSNDNAIELEDEYAGYVFNETLMNNNLKLLQLEAEKKLRSLRQESFSNVWDSVRPASATATYHYLKNQILIPAAILQIPFFNKDSPRYLNYGGIGTVIGHEIAHSLDSISIHFDNQDIGRILTLTAKEQFRSRRKCFKEQYNNYALRNTSITMNTFTDEDEDIADNVGLRLAFFAYQRWAKANSYVDKLLPGLSKYTPEQLFFINYAHTRCEKLSGSFTKITSFVDAHSFEQFRVIGSLSNFEEFDRAFKCRPGLGTSRTDKCVLW